MKALDDSAITDRCTLYGDPANVLKDESTDRCTLYEDLANFSKDERFTKNIRPQQTFERCTPRTQESPHELARQSEAKLKQAPQSEANVCRRRRRTKMQSQKNRPY